MARDARPSRGENRRSRERHGARGLSILALLLLAAAQRHEAPSVSSSRVHIDVAIVADERFAPLNDDAVNAALQSAQGTFQQKFGSPQLGFSTPKRLDVHQFFSGLPADDFNACVARHDTRRAVSLADYDRPRLTEAVSSFLSRWRLPALVPAFPPELRPQIRSHDDASRALVGEMRAAAEKAFSATFADGTPVLTGALGPGRRFVDWLCAFEVQRDNDVVLTNSYVFYDLITEPYPHAVYHGSRLAGAVMQSPHRESFFGRAVFVSTFGFEGQPTTLLEPGYGAFDPSQRDAFIGTYLLAHELGHALLRIPDVYDHGAKCLMTTDYAAGYVDGFKRLLDNPGKCPRCAPYVDARKLVQKMDEYLRRKRLVPAERMADKAVKHLPPNLDGSTGDYAARVYTRLATAEYEGGRYRKAELFARKALASDPLHAAARMLLRKVQQRLNVPASR